MANNNVHDGEQGVFKRALFFCSGLGHLNANELYKACWCCGDYLLTCCTCTKRYSKMITPCHHFQLVFTDGACSYNGNENARSGIGIAYGDSESAQISLPVDSKLDPEPMRSSQRAEMLAAIEGLRLLATAAPTSQRLKHADSKEGPKSQKRFFVIATDSRYVVDGMTKWLPKWKNNGWRTTEGRRPKNLDLFLKLDRAVTEQELVHNRDVGFWHISREFNTVADVLAKYAAAHAVPLGAEDKEQ